MVIKVGLFKRHSFVLFNGNANTTTSMIFTSVAKVCVKNLVDFSPSSFCFPNRIFMYPNLHVVEEDDKVGFDFVDEGGGELGRGGSCCNRGSTMHDVV